MELSLLYKYSELDQSSYFVNQEAVSRLTGVSVDFKDSVLAW